MKAITKALIPTVIFVVGLIMFIGGLAYSGNPTLRLHELLRRLIMFTAGFPHSGGTIIFLGFTVITAGVILLCLEITVGCRKKTKVLVLAVALLLSLFPFAAYYLMPPKLGPITYIRGVQLLNLITIGCWFTLGALITIVCYWKKVQLKEEVKQNEEDNI